jgi:hypothetical protein
MATSNHYLGVDPNTRLGGTPRFFYGIRKNENGSLFLVRSDQYKEADTIEINNPGDDIENYNEFEVGVDFFEGIDVTHNAVYENLKYVQYKWDDRAIFYYVDDEGQLVARVNNGYTYTPGVSED